MNTSLLKDCLTRNGIRELGIPIVLPSFSESLSSLFQWTLEGKSYEGRQLWFIVSNAEDLRNQIAAELRNRIMPLHPSILDMIFKRGPYDSLLLPKHGFYYSDPNLLLSDFWKQRGFYKQLEEFSSEDMHLWIWSPYEKKIKLFAMDHHHAVLWDAMKILRPLGIEVDFHWLCDGRPPINEAIASEVPSFQSSLNIYKPPVDTKLTAEFKEYIEKGGYQGILTSHSLVTCFRLSELQLPMFHVNSTRFGNEWIQNPERHDTLVKRIHELLLEDRLRVLHNNQGDVKYFHQYFPRLAPQQELVIPSLCENLLRIRKEPPKEKKILIWDTRQVLLQQHGSPFMKELYVRLKDAWGPALESQAICMAEKRSYLPEGYLDQYTAIIHIPYNVSTMSMFQQVRANIPIWVPSKRLLAKLWADEKEPNELSWTVFAAGSEKQASTMDKVRDPTVIEKWLETADFYQKDILPLSFEFDSIEELMEKGLTTDYASHMNLAEMEQERRREQIIFSWEQIIRGGLKL